MQFSLSFFPTVRPERQAGEDYYREALDLAVLAEDLGYSRIRSVEHYFKAYGGYLPDPVVFLTAVAMRTHRIRLCTAAVLPAFHHPIHLAAKLAMLDCLSGGRVDAGFARAFLPYEFDAFQVSLDDSRPRFEEGVAACRRLWSEEEVEFAGPFHQFGPVTLLPRPAQRPHPPIWIAAVMTPQSFQWAGEQGYGLMVVPYLSDFDRLAENLRLYREAYRAGGHPGVPRVQLTFHAYLAEDRATAEREAREYINEYMALFTASALAWGGRTSGQ